ncbi:Metallo-dependent phosphatase-like protein [Suillus clintonianus]|uniref:Metallo-dependent phosphatase-like protein n=1 Tax=Suillus clintonianus TaxID=1904413 RepID=UPI001B87EC8C|nr:Metallo-dependent phosphatase-like protein [Suillus clintonianus]KAG2156070.1 Metallo-dependent phosphatase-like protein [Suillus clintonianus]
MKKRIPWLAGLLCGQVLAAPSQVVLNAAPSRPDRKLHGRFLHITDIHPDPYYEKGASQSSQCHRTEPHDKQPAGYYGVPFSTCDSPWSLTNFTFEYLEDHWSSDIDFVVWTGDNARHDEDNEIPRTVDEIFALNRAVAKKMEDAFLRKGIPVVPSLGNNDVWPQNTLSPGPNNITNEFASIWDAFIPSDSKTSFRKGAYYAVEVIPDALAVISLSTMYFYHNNKAVRGCLVGDASDPGNLHLEWLEEQLERFRARQVQVWVTGHVPPALDHFFPECYYRYAELSLRYQDIILGSLFGHLNVDHFYFVEAADLNISPEEDTMPSHSFEGTIYETLMADFEELVKTKKHLNYDDYAVISVSPSLVPTYLPSFRVFNYNISGLGSTTVGAVGEDEYLLMTKMDRASRRKHLPYRHGNDGNDGRQCMGADYRDSWRCKLQPWRSDSHAPSRQNSLWSPLGYAQYYIPQVEEYDESHEPRFKLEYLTFPISSLHLADGPVPLRNLPKSLREAGVTESEFAPYGMHDLTIPSWLDLACKLGKPREKKLRKRFKKYMYMGGSEI